MQVVNFVKGIDPSPERKNRWGSRKLALLKDRLKVKKKSSPGQKALWQEWEKPNEAIQAVAKKFVLANCLNPAIASLQFEQYSSLDEKELYRCQVTDPGNPDSS